MAFSQFLWHFAWLGTCFLDEGVATVTAAASDFAVEMVLEESWRRLFLEIFGASDAENGGFLMREDSRTPL